ncbi:MAG: hypothetical protein ABSG03_16750 [Bryobacteraceae bacterium]|jgi:zinc protease
MCTARAATLILVFGVIAWPQTPPLKTAAEVLERYRRAIGGVDAIKKVQSETRHGEMEQTGMNGRATFVGYAKPFLQLNKVALPDGHEVLSGFNGGISWSVSPKGASIDKDTPVESARRDADLQYELHQPDYFRNFELAGAVDFEGRRCYWLHGITHWGKDNNQYYDVETGLLAGYRFESDSSTSAAVTTLLFQDYKSFGGPLVATKVIARTGDSTQTVTFTSVSYGPLEDSIFELPQAVKALQQ